MADSSLAQTAPSGQTAPPAASGRIHQSVCRWCYKEMTVDQLAEAGAGMGLKGVDLLEVSEFEIPRKYGLICTMGYVGGGTIPEAMNRVENHAAIEEAFFLGLRLTRGVNLREVEAKFGEGSLAGLSESVADLVRTGLIEKEGDVIRLTPRGRLLSNEVFERFISVQNGKVPVP